MTDFKTPVPTLAEQAQAEFRLELEKLWSGENEALFAYTVEVKHRDGSTFLFKHASCKKAGKVIYVFTEHNGAHGFYIEDLELQSNGTPVLQREE